MLVRDSSRIRTKSLRIASSLERVDDLVAGGATREAGRDHGLAEPLERARDVDALAARHRRLLDRCGGGARRVKFGTSSVLSSAALSVTVMIIAASSPALPRLMPLGHSRQNIVSADRRTRCQHDSPRQRSR